MALVYAIAAVRLLLHLFTNGQYGFHRDELATLDDARFLDWGFVAYPPITPAIGRLGLELFGLSTNGIRFFAALAQSAAIVLTGDMARRLGGSHFAIAFAALCTACAPISIGAGALFQYVSFDYLWWVLLLWSLLRLELSGDSRWWLAAGAAIGLGMQTKYTMGVCVLALAVAVLATPARRHLRSPWLYAGALLSILLVSPNLLWQVRHDFISLDFLRSIHERDIRIGRTDMFLPGQLLVPANLFSVPVWLAGLWYLLRRAELRHFGVWYLAVLAIFTATQGRDYYMGPAYPILFAAGALAVSSWRILWRRTITIALAAAGCFFAAIITPMAPTGTAWFQFASGINGDLREEIGWPELVDAVAHVYGSLPHEERAAAGLLVGNYGEAGALNLYGPKYGLPRAMSGVNSHWLRGPVEPAPRTLVVMGFREDTLRRWFDSVELAGRVSIPHGVKNEEAGKPEIYLCRGLKQPWPEFWRKFRYFG